MATDEQRFAEAQAAIRAKDYVRGIALLDDLALHRASAPISWWRATALRELGRWEEAARDFSATAAMLHDSPEGPSFGTHANRWKRIQALASAGECLMTFGRLRESDHTFREALVEATAYRNEAPPDERARIEPSHAWLHTMASETARKLGRVDEAIELARQATTLAPADGNAQVTLGLALQANHDHAQAIAAFARAEQLRPDLTETRAHTAQSLAALGRHDDSLVAWSSFRAISPQRIEGYVQPVAILRELGKLDEAGALLQQAIDKLQPTPDHLFALAKSHAQIDDFAGAEALFTRVLELAPHHAAARYARASHRVFELADHEGARADLEALLELPGRAQDPRLHYLLAEAFFGAGNYALALPHYRTSLENETNPALVAELHGRIAEILYDSSQPRDAIPHLESFLQLVDTHPDLAVRSEDIEWARETLTELN